MMSLLKYKWYRSLFVNRTFVKSDGIWIDKKDYIKGKITDVSGRTSQAFCDCGHELIHSDCLIEEHKLEAYSIFEFKCSNCGSIVYYNPDIIPGMIKCNSDGIPLQY